MVKDDVVLDDEFVLLDGMQAALIGLHKMYYINVPGVQ